MALVTRLLPVLTEMAEGNQLPECAALSRDSKTKEEVEAARHNGVFWRMA
jgi:hypothetical protein